MPKRQRSDFFMAIIFFQQKKYRKVVGKAEKSSATRVGGP